MSKTSQMTRVEWNKLNWRKLERVLFKLQNRILRAAQRGDEKAVRKLQKTLTRSWSAKCLALRDKIIAEKPKDLTQLASKTSEHQANLNRAKVRLFGNKKGLQNTVKRRGKTSGVKKGDRILNSAEKIRNCTQSLSFLLKANKTAKLEDLIPKINQIIYTWLTHNSHQCNRKLLKRIYHDLHQIIMYWGRRRTGSYQRAYNLYWQQLDGKINPQKIILTGIY